jgi:hypothetical protein
MNLQQAFLTVASKIPVEDIKVKQRLDRAYDIVQCGGSGYAITKSLRHNEYAWHVHKASTSPLDTTATMYTVDGEGCSCPDAVSARAGLCKHKLATMIVAEMEK